MSFRFKPKPETENKTIRFPKPLIEAINAVVREDDSFSSFVLQACEYALEHMEMEDREVPLPDIKVPKKKK